MLKRLFLRLVMLVATLVGLQFTVPVVLAQESAAVTGAVRDESGAVLPGVSVTLKNLDTGVARSLVTDDQGRYHASNLTLGKYEIQAELSGFQTSVRAGIELTLGREAAVDFTLKVGEITEKMIVTGEAPMVETTNSTIAGLVSTTQLESLPLNGRSFSELATLQPGVVASTGSGGGAAQGYGAKITISGTRPYEASFTLDGQDINDTYNFVGSAAGIVTGVDAVREFKVITNPYSSEYGRMAGGQVQIATKSGTNDLHGSFYEYLRNSALDARNFFDPGAEPPPFKRSQFGGSAGGPVVRDRTFFFGNFEGLRQRQGLTQISTVPDRNAHLGLIPNAAGVLQNIGVQPNVRPYLELYPLPNLQVFTNGTGQFAWTNNHKTDEDYYLGKIDHNFDKFLGFGESNNFQGRYSIDTAEHDSAENIIADRVDLTRSQYLSLTLNTVVSPRVVNRGQVAYNRSRIASFNVAGERLLASGNPNIMKLANVQLQGYGSIGPGSGVTGIGGDTLSPRNFVLNLFQYKDDISIQAGRHSLTLGANVEKFDNNWLHTFGAVGSFSFQNLTAFLRGQATSFTADTPDSSFFRTFRQMMFGWYLQDDFRVSSNLTLNLGIRHEWITVPVEKYNRLYIFKDLFNPNAPDPLTTPVQGFFKNPSLKNFAPRFGLAWDPKGNGKMAIRAGFGVFHSQLINATWRFPAAQNTPIFLRETIIASAVPNGGLIDFPNAFKTQAHLLGGAINIQGIDPEPKQPVTLQYSLNIQRELFKDTVVTLEYTGIRGFYLERVTDWNFRVPVKQADGRLFFGPNAPIFNPKADRYWINSFDSASWYNAFRLNFNRRFGDKFGYQASYTFSKSIDRLANVSGGTDYSNDSMGQRSAGGPLRMPPEDDQGPSGFDVRQSFTSSFTYNVPIGSGHALTLGRAGDMILGGWSINGIIKMAAGAPIQISGARTSNSRALPSYGALGGGPPDLVPGRSSNPVRPGNPDQYVDPTAFSLPPVGYFGNLGRHTAIGPGLRSFDLSFFKSFSVGEKLKGQFRGEFFNVFNRANFSLGGVTLFDSTTFGYSPTAGRITSTNSSSRQIQLALRFVF